MRVLIPLLILISLTSCTMLQRSDQEVRQEWASQVARGDVAAACELAAYPSVCNLIWSSRLHGAYMRGELGTFTIEGDMARFAGGVCWRIILNEAQQVVDVRELWECPAQPVPVEGAEL